MIELGTLNKGVLTLRRNAMQTQSLGTHQGHLSDLTHDIGQDFVVRGGNQCGLKTCIHGRPAL